MREQLMILLCDLVEAVEVYAEMKRAIFLAYEEHRCGVGRGIYKAWSNGTRSL